MPKRRSKYPWAKWTNGGEYTAWRGLDYTISTHNFQISVHGRARFEGKRVVTRTRVGQRKSADGVMARREGLIFQFHEDGLS